MHAEWYAMVQLNLSCGTLPYISCSHDETVHRLWSHISISSPAYML